MGKYGIIHNRTAREDMTYRVASDGWVEMLPMNQVLAYSMAPVHIAPLRGFRTHHQLQRSATADVVKLDV